MEIGNRVRVTARRGRVAMLSGALATVVSKSYDSLREKPYYEVRLDVIATRTGFLDMGSHRLYGNEISLYHPAS